MADQTQVLTRNISLYPQEDRTVMLLDERFGFRNYSVAVRYIINEWARLAGFGNDGGDGEPRSIPAFVHSPGYPAEPYADAPQ